MRNLICIIISSIIFICCNDRSLKKENALNLSKQIFLNVDSSQINGQKVFAYCDKNDFFFVLNSSGDTLFRQEELLSNFKFVDFDLDGHNDIFINWFSGAPDTKTLLLYDTIRNNFRLITNFEDYPAPKRLLNTNLYYSYSKSGCGDLNWTSELFKIEKFAVKKLGYIYAYGCDKNKDFSGINIHKVSIDNKEVLVDKRPIEILENYKDYKWGFIEKYWTNNYKKFLN